MPPGMEPAPVSPRAALPAFALAPVAAVAVLSVLVHAVCIERYGVFRDELYYVACGEHLAWGYVDHPPLSIALAQSPPPGVKAGLLQTAARAEGANRLSRLLPRSHGLPPELLPPRIATTSSAHGDHLRRNGAVASLPRPTRRLRSGRLRSN